MSIIKVTNFDKVNPHNRIINKTNNKKITYYENGVKKQEEFFKDGTINTPPELIDFANEEATELSQNMGGKRVIYYKNGTKKEEEIPRESSFDIPTEVNNIINDGKGRKVLLSMRGKKTTYYDDGRIKEEEIPPRRVFNVPTDLNNNNSNKYFSGRDKINR